MGLVMAEGILVSLRGMKRLGIFTWAKRILIKLAPQWTRLGDLLLF